MTRHFLVLAAVALAACGSVNSQSVRSASLGEEVVLAPNERAQFDGGKLEVQFAGVIEDSRCPRDVACVWAGEIRIRLRARTDAGPPSEHDVREGEHANVGGYQVHLLKVSPERLTDKQIAASDYRATLKASQG